MGWAGAGIEKRIPEPMTTENRSTLEFIGKRELKRIAMELKTKVIPKAASALSAHIPTIHIDEWLGIF